MNGCLTALENVSLMMACIFLSKNVSLTDFTEVIFMNRGRAVVRTRSENNGIASQS